MDVKLDLKALDELDQKLRTKIIRKAVSDTAKPVKDKVKSSAPVRTGGLAKAIGMKMSVKKGRTTAVVGARSKYVQNKQTLKRIKPVKKAKTGFVRALQGIAHALNKHLIYRPSKIAHLVERGGLHNKATHFLSDQFAPTEFFDKVCEDIRGAIG